MGAKPRYLRLLRKYYRTCHVQTEWFGEVLYMNGRCVCFYQSKPYRDKTNDIYIMFRYVESDNNFSFPVRNFNELLNGIKRFDGSLVYKVKLKSKKTDAVSAFNCRAGTPHSNLAK